MKISSFHYYRSTESLIVIMSKRISEYFFILFLIILSPQLSSQSFNEYKYYADSNNPATTKYYLFTDQRIKASADLIKMDSIITNSIQGSGSKHLFQHNENNKITEWLVLGNAGSGWFNSWKHNLFYDEQDNLITEIHLGWYLNEWDSLSRLDYIYDIGIVAQRIFQIYENNSWENWGRSNYTYDLNKNVLNTLNEIWINNDWQNDMLITNHYSTQNKKDSILFQMWVNNEWQNDKKTIFYYNGNEIDIDFMKLNSVSACHSRESGNLKEGTYYYHFEAGDYKVVKEMQLLK
jgi:hypothetical protein